MEELEASLINNLVLTKRVNLERGIRKGGIYSPEKTTDVTATSNFGKEHEIANVECIIAGLSGVFEQSSIITNAQFWESIGEGIDTLNLTLLFDEQYSYALKSLELDYLVVADHQRIDVGSYFHERITDGFFIDEDKEAAATVTIDIKNKRVLNATEIDAGHFKAVGHFLFYIPVALHTYPDEDPCNMAGRIAADAITQSITTGKAPRIAVVTGDWKSAERSYKKESQIMVLQKRARQGDQDAQWELYQMNPNAENMAWLCRDADQGKIRARSELGMLYFYGSDIYRERMNVHIPANVSRSCMWFHLAGQAQITGQPETKGVELMSMPYESAEVGRTSKVMTADELAEAEQLIQAWKPGQCNRDFSRRMLTEFSKDLALARLCTAADLGDFISRDELGRIYFLGSRGVKPDLPRAYMWYKLAAKVYVPPGMRGGNMQPFCDDMTPEQRSIAIKLLEKWKPGQCEQDLLQ